MFVKVRLGTHNARFVVWPLELGLGTHNARFVAWPIELGLGTHNARFVAWPLELGSRWLFQKWSQEVDVEEVLTATLPNEPVSGDEELAVLSNPLLASPPCKEVKKKEVQSSDSEVNLFAPPPTAPVPQKKVKGKKALPSAPPVDPPTSKRRIRSTIPSETTLWGWEIG